MTVIRSQVETLLISGKLEQWVMGLELIQSDELIISIHTDEGIVGLGSSHHGHTPHFILRDRY